MKLDEVRKTLQEVLDVNKYNYCLAQLLCRRNSTRSGYSTGLIQQNHLRTSSRMSFGGTSQVRARKPFMMELCTTGSAASKTLHHDRIFSAVKRKIVGKDWAIETSRHLCHTISIHGNMVHFTAKLQIASNCSISSFPYSVCSIQTPNLLRLSAVQAVEAVRAVQMRNAGLKHQSPDLHKMTM